jgi:GNAT superfamily N-acetyltransferase
MDVFWKSFLRHCARQSVHGSLRKLEGIEAAWVHSALLINNGTYLTSPVGDENDLRDRISSALADAEPHQLPWVLYLFQPYLREAGIDESREAALVSSFGFHRMGGLRVMTGDVHRFARPAHPLPSSVEFRRVTSREDSWTALDLNTRAYGMPLEITGSVVDSGAYFRDRNREFGFVAWANDVPVSTATVIELDGWLYVAAVATDPAHRQKGYAEAVMRQALTAASATLGISRTALDASLMGAPLYEQMGYRQTGAEWGMYVLG